MKPKNPMGETSKSIGFRRFFGEIWRIIGILRKGEKGSKIDPFSGVFGKAPKKRRKKRDIFSWPYLISTVLVKKGGKKGGKTG